MICCLNPACPNPPCPNGTKFCSHCGIPLVTLDERYRPTRQLGSGGFGRTYLAEDGRKFNEQCVIKQLAPQVQGTGALQIATRLFEEEARRLQQLGQHPQIPTLLAYFEQDNRLYLVQEYIEGQNLLDELELQGAFSEQKIRELLFDLLDILKSVHQEKIIHRDIKPENIIRRKTDSKLVLIDFGASKQLSATIVTKPGTTIGSFGYAPPEQMEGGEAYPASDLYSLGATCFHLLSDINPWELWKRQAYGWINNWRQHLRQPVSQEVGRVLDKLLQEDYQQRYQSAEAALQDLNRQSSPLPAVSPKKSPPPQSSPKSPAVPAKVSPLPQPLPKPFAVSPKASPLLQPSLPSPVASRKQKAKFKNPLLLGGAILLLATQMYGYCRYGFFPSNPMFLISSLPSSIFLKTTLSAHTKWVISLAISPNGQTLVSGSSDDTIKIWNLEIQKLKTTLSGHMSYVNSIVISPDGQTLVSGSADKTIKIWNLKTGELNRTITGHTDFVHSVAISSDGQTLVSDDGKNIKTWNLITGKLNSTLTGHTESVYSVAISLDGQTLVSGSYDKTIKIWNLKTNELKATLTGHSNYIWTVAISPDGHTLVTGSKDQTIKIWNLKTGELKTTLIGHSGTINSVTISPDGQTLVSGSDDRTIKIWNLKTSQLKTTLIGHSDSVRSVVINPDGQTLVSGSQDQTMKIWRMPK